MPLGRHLKSLAVSAYLGAPRLRAEFLTLAGRGGDRGRIELYFQSDDPYSYLVAQLAPALGERYRIPIELRLCPPPDPEMAPEPERRASHAVRDARALADYYQLDFPATAAVADPGLRERANRVLARDREPGDRLRAAVAVGAALWAGDQAAMTAAEQTWGAAGDDRVAAVTAANHQRRRRLGHYLGGMLLYRGEWYWGVDRLGELEARLGARHPGPPLPPLLVRRPPAERPPAPLTERGQSLAMELYFSFRSPYSYLALERTFALADRYPIELTVRPVLPMVMRNLAVPPAKTLYIVRDAKREADRLGIRFGRICDPVGVGVERCLALHRHAREQGRERPLLLAAARGIWGEGRDVADDGDLAAIAAAAGLDWPAARAALADPGWRSEVEDNRRALLDAGLWGVPSFRIGDYVTWGQDRLELIEDRIRRHLEW